MTRLFQSVLLGALVVLAAGQAALAADHPIKGDSLVMRQARGGRKAMFHTIDAALDPRMAPDPRRSGATLEILGGGDKHGSSGLITLAPQFWSALGTPAGSAGYRYLDPDATTGVKQVLLSPSHGGGKLAVTAGGDNWRFSLDHPQHNVSVRLTIATEIYCTQFNRQDMARNEVGNLSANHAPAPATCMPPVCGNGYIDPGEECDSPLLGTPGCCLDGCVLADDAFCHPDFARSSNTEKAKLNATYKQRIHTVFRKAVLHQDEPKAFGRFAKYVELLRVQPKNLFDLAMSLFSGAPDQIPAFRDDVRRFSPLPHANRAGEALSDQLQILLDQVDVRQGPPARPTDYLQDLLANYDAADISTSDIPTVKDPHLVDDSCNGYGYCAVNPLHFNSMTLPNSLYDDQINFDENCPNASTCQWPRKYDLIPRRIYLEWGTILPVNEVEDILAENGYAVSLSINGTPLPFKGPQFSYEIDKPQQQWWGATYPCQAGDTKGCLMTVLVSKNIANVLKTSTLPWKITLDVSKIEPLDPPQVKGIDENGHPIIVGTQAVPYATASITLTANPTNNTSYFEAIIYPTFQSDRCMDCHGFGNFDKISDHHGGYDFSSGKYEPSAYDPNGHVMTCYNCHDGKDGNPQGSLVTSFEGGNFTETQWKAPATDLDVDWKTKNASQTCVRVKQNLPTRELRRKHFHEDARLYWAIEDPRIFNKHLTKAFPEDFALFLSSIDAWNDSDAPCP